MIHVPVQDSWETQLAQMVNLDSQRPACQPQLSCYLHEIAESDTFQRDWYRRRRLFISVRWP